MNSYLGYIIKLTILKDEEEINIESKVRAEYNLNADGVIFRILRIGIHEYLKDIYSNSPNKLIISSIEICDQDNFLVFGISGCEYKIDIPNEIEDIVDIIDIMVRDDDYCIIIEEVATTKSHIIKLHQEFNKF